MNPDRDIAEMKKLAFVREKYGFRSGHRRADRGHIHGFMMPGAGRALLITVQRIARMIVGDGSKRPHAQVERADNSCYPTPFHPVWPHKYGALPAKSSRFHTVLQIIGIPGCD